MNNECVADFDNLIRKSYNELGIYGIDSSLNYADMFAIANNFSTHFKEVTLCSPYVIVLKTIAYLLQSKRVVLDKNKLYDFFITSFKFLIESRGEKKENPVSIRSELIDGIFFEICNDLLSSYDCFMETIKIQIPNLIVDVITALLFKSDPYGKKMSSFQIKPYYISKKESLMTHNFVHSSKELGNLSHAVCFTKGANIQNQHGQKKIINFQKVKKLESNSDAAVVVLDDKKFNDDYKDDDDDVIYRISLITRRDGNSIRQSLTTLPKKEIKKLCDICNNYDKLIEYGKLDNLRDLKLAIESDLKRPLSDKQARHSRVSIKKIQYYVENMLDKKFEPHLTHGINHVKHNFEYGYRLVGLIGNSRSIHGPIQVD